MDEQREICRYSGHAWRTLIGGKRCDRCGKHVAQRMTDTEARGVITETIVNTTPHLLTDDGCSCGLGVHAGTMATWRGMPVEVQRVGAVSRVLLDQIDANPVPDDPITFEMHRCFVSFEETCGQSPCVVPEDAP